MFLHWKNKLKLLFKFNNCATITYLLKAEVYSNCIDFLLVSTTERHLRHDIVFSSSRHPNKPLCSRFLWIRNTTASLNVIHLPQGINRYPNYRHFTAEQQDKDTDRSHSTQPIEGDGNLCWESKCCSPRTTGPFTVPFPCSHLPSQSQASEQTAQMTEQQSHPQSPVGPGRLTLPSLRPRNLSLCKHPWQLTAANTTHIPSHNNCRATRKRDLKNCIISHRSSIQESPWSSTFSFLPSYSSRCAREKQGVLRCLCSQGI